MNAVGEAAHVKVSKWEPVTGERVTTLITKGASPRWQGFSYTQSGMLFVTSENVRDGYLDLSKPKFLPLEFHKKIYRSRLQKGDILINLVGASIGRSCLVRKDLGEANINQAVAVFRPVEDVDEKFLSFYFQLPETVERILGMQVEAARPNISLGDLRRFKLALPPREEQEAIAEALSDADALIEGLEWLIAKKRRIKQGAMQDLLTAKRRLPGFSGEWKTESLNDLLLRATGGGTPSRTVKDYWEGDIPWMTVKDFTFGSRHSTLESITEQGLKNSASASIPAGTLILCTRMAVGKTAIMSVDVAINQDLKALFFGDDCIPRFYQLLFELRQREIEESAGGSTVKGVSLKDIRAIEMPKPRKDEQMKLAQVFDDMDAEVQALETRLAKARHVKEGMMQNLLTGRIRLV